MRKAGENAGKEKISNNQDSKGRTERKRKRNETVEYRLLPFVKPWVIALGLNHGV